MAAEPEAVTTASNPGTSPRKAAAEFLLVWSLMAASTTITAWSSLQARTFRDPDDATRLVQVRELLAGQSWWDLSLDRIGNGIAEMHWSRHLDALLVGVILPLRPLIGAESAELVAIIAAPLGLLLVALWLVSSLARLLSPLEDIGLYAMAVFGFGAAALNRLSPGALDHHGLQMVLMLLMLRMLLGSPSWRSGLLAGVAGGVSLTVGLETLPVVAATTAGLAIRWAVDGARPRSEYQSLGLGLLAGGVAVDSPLWPSRAAAVHGM